jgi:hypothetical protein
VSELLTSAVPGTLGSSANIFELLQKVADSPSSEPVTAEFGQTLGPGRTFFHLHSARELDNSDTEPGSSGKKEYHFDGGDPAFLGTLAALCI